MKYLKEDLFKTVMRSTPLVAVDLVFITSDNKVLLGKRVNKPAQGFWFVPGGRIFKDEAIRDAIIRIAENEVGLDLKSLKVKPLGVFEHQYDENVFGDQQFCSHYIVLAYVIKLSADDAICGDNQHEILRWWKCATALSQDDVHHYTKDYLQQIALNEY